MWYFAWILGVGFAILLAILNAMWGETEEDRNTLPVQPVGRKAAGKPSSPK